jgi:hypothetical protein
MPMDTVEPEVEGQRKSSSDERLKQAIEGVDGALASLRELDEPEVEGQRKSSSDERLKQAIDRVEGALGDLHRLQGALGEDKAEVKGQLLTS